MVASRSFAHARHDSGERDGYSWWRVRDETECLRRGRVHHDAVILGLDSVEEDRALVGVPESAAAPSHLGALLEAFTQSRSDRLLIYIESLLPRETVILKTDAREA
jgi:hypothetical protein